MRISVLSTSRFFSRKPVREAEATASPVQPSLLTHRGRGGQQDGDSNHPRMPGGAPTEAALLTSPLTSLSGQQGSLPLGLHLVLPSTDMSHLHLNPPTPTPAIPTTTPSRSHCHSFFDHSPPLCCLSHPSRLMAQRLGES